MAGKFETTHEIDCTTEVFWRTFLDNNFNEQLYKDWLGYPQFSVMAQNETDNEAVRQWIFSPKWDLPGPVSKLVGSPWLIQADGTLDKKTGFWKVKYTSKTMADKIRLEANMRLELVDDKRVRRIIGNDLEVKIFGIGGLMESSLEKNLRQDSDKTAAFMNKWIAEHQGL